MSIRPFIKGNQLLAQLTAHKLSLLYTLAPASVDINNVQTSSPLKPLGQSKPNLMWSLTWEGGTIVYINGPGHMAKMAANAHIMMKAFKNLLLQNQKSYDLETKMACSIRNSSSTKFI